MSEDKKLCYNDNKRLNRLCRECAGLGFDFLRKKVITIKTIYRYIKPYVPIMSLQLFIKFIGTVVELLLPWMLSRILDDIVPLKEMEGIYLWGGMMVFASAAAFAANVIANRMSTRISADITKKLRRDLFEKVSYLSCAQTDTFTIPSLISRLTSDTYNVQQMIDRMQRLGVRAPILLMGGIFVTLAMEPALALVLIGTLPILGLVVWLVSRKGIPLYAKTQKALDGMVRKVQENMSGVRVIKALSKGQYEREKFDEANCQCGEQRATCRRIDGRDEPGDEFPVQHRACSGDRSRRIPGERGRYAARRNHCVSELLHHHAQTPS